MLSEGESMAITAEGVAAAGTAEAESYTLPDKHETQRELRGGGMGFWNLKAHPQWQTSSNKVTPNPFQLAH